MHSLCYYGLAVELLLDKIKPTPYLSTKNLICYCGSAVEHHLGKTKTALFNHLNSPQKSIKKQHYAGVAQR